MPRRTEYDHLPIAERLPARILEMLERFGGKVSKHTLERKMSAHKKRGWKEALNWLIFRRYIQLTHLGSRRQVMITLRQIPKRLLGKPIIIKKRIKRRRPQTEWFKAHLQEFRERDGYGDGPDLDSVPGPGDNDPPPWLAPEPFTPEPPAINLAEPPGWRNRRR